VYVAACVLGIYVLSIIFSGQGNSSEDSSVMRIAFWGTLVTIISIAEVVGAKYSPQNDDGKYTYSVLLLLLLGKTLSSMLNTIHISFAGKCRLVIRYFTKNMSGLLLFEYLFLAMIKEISILFKFLAVSKMSLVLFGCLEFLNFPVLLVIISVFNRVSSYFGHTSGLKEAGNTELGISTIMVFAAFILVSRERTFEHSSEGVIFMVISRVLSTIEKIANDFLINVQLSGMSHAVKTSAKVYAGFLLNLLNFLAFTQIFINGNVFDVGSNPSWGSTIGDSLSRFTDSGWGSFSIWAYLICVAANDLFRTSIFKHLGSGLKQCFQFIETAIITVMFSFLNSYNWNIEDNTVSLLAVMIILTGLVLFPRLGYLEKIQYLQRRLSTWILPEGRVKMSETLLTSDDDEDLVPYGNAGYSIQTKD